jgi:hypothetical protein
VTDLFFHIGATPHRRKEGSLAWTDEDIQAYIDEHWPRIKDHPEDCPCEWCWEFIVITQK